MLEIREVDTFYGDFQVLKGVSLNVSEGEFVVLLGPNGHGKSTLLKTICGLVKPTSGQIKFNGKEIHKLPIQKIVEMGLVYIAEERHLFPEMSVIENLKLGAYNPNARQKEAENLDYVFQLFPKVKSLKKRLVSRLSGGERRMVAVGRGIMASAKFLAIDEPSLGLAPNLTIEVFKKINEINKSGVSILLVEQSITEALKYADRVYVMEEGKIVFEGKKKEILGNEQVKKVLLGTS